MQGYNLYAGVLVAAVSLHVSGFSRPTQPAQDGDVGINSMAYLGTLDGKSFFYERSPLRTWFEAKEACIASNMHLASITSLDQTNFVNQALNWTENYYWTAGRDSQKISQFVWDGKNINLTLYGLMQFGFKNDFQNCLSFHPRDYLPGILFGEVCTTKRGTLCEVDHSLHKHEQIT